MTAYARIITTGRNNTMPRFIRMPIGVYVDGSAATTTIQALDDEILCPICEGWGFITVSPNNPSERDRTENCERCDGAGLIIEHNISGGDECLPPSEIGPCGTSSRLQPQGPHQQLDGMSLASGLGGSVDGSRTEPSSYSGMTPASGASAGLMSLVQRSQAHPLTGVPKIIALHRPASDFLPPKETRAALWATVEDVAATTLGFAMLCAVAYFFLVLA